MTAAALLLSGTLATSGCFFGKKQAPPRVFVPPPVTAKVPAAPAKIEMEPPPSIPAEVKPATTVAATETLPSPEVTPPKPVPPAKLTRAPEEAATVTAPPAAPPPKPAQIFSAEQQRSYTKEYDESVQRVKGALALLAGRNLTAGQRGEVNQISSFLRQAEQAHESNLSTAVELARRADLLAKDLLGRLP